MILLVDELRPSPVLERLAHWDHSTGATSQEEIIGAVEEERMVEAMDEDEMQSTLKTAGRKDKGIKREEISKLIAAMADRQR